MINNLRRGSDRPVFRQILELQDQKIDEFDVVYERRPTDSGALKLWKGRSGQAVKKNTNSSHIMQTTKHFTITETENLSIDISELHKNRRMFGKIVARMALT